MPPERRAGARTLPPQRLGDAAQLTLLMAQTLAAVSLPNRPAALAAYGEPVDRDAIFALSA